MTNTEKQFWVNGYSKHGGWFRTLSFSLWSYGVCISGGIAPDQHGRTGINLEIFKLI